MAALEQRRAKVEHRRAEAEWRRAAAVQRGSLWPGEGRPSPRCIGPSPKLIASLPQLIRPRPDRSGVGPTLSSLRPGTSDLRPTPIGFGEAGILMQSFSERGPSIAPWDRRRLAGHILLDHGGRQWALQPRAPISPPSIRPSKKAGPLAQPDVVPGVASSDDHRLASDGHDNSHADSRSAVLEGGRRRVLAASGRLEAAIWGRCQ